MPLTAQAEQLLARMAASAAEPLEQMSITA